MVKHTHRRKRDQRQRGVGMRRLKKNQMKQKTEQSKTTILRTVSAVPPSHFYRKKNTPGPQNLPTSCPVSPLTEQQSGAASTYLLVWVVPLTPVLPPHLSPRPCTVGGAGLCFATGAATPALRKTRPSGKLGFKSLPVRAQRRQ